MSELGQGIAQGLGYLALGIARRKQSQADMEMQAESARALDDYLKTGVVNPALLRVPGATQALFGQMKSQQPETLQRDPSKEVGQVSGGEYRAISPAVEKPPAPPSNPRPPYRSAAMGEDGQPKFVNKGGAVLQEYDLVSPITGQKVGKSYTKIDDESRADPNTQAVMGNIANSFLRNPAVNKDQQMLDASSTIIELLDSKNPVADNSIPTFMARASGEVGNLSEADKAPFGGSAAITKRVNQVVERAATGALTDDNRKFVRDLAVIMGESAKRRRSSIAKKYAKTYSKAHKIPEEDITLMLDPDNVISNEPPEGEQFKIIEVK